MIRCPEPGELGPHNLDKWLEKKYPKSTKSWIKKIVGILTKK